MSAYEVLPRVCVSCINTELPTGTHLAYLNFFLSLSRFKSDCHLPNVLMNADAMYPGGFHPAKQSMAPDWKGKAKHFSRTERLPKYYLIDFGLSVRFRPNDSTPRARVVRGGDHDYPPELEDMNAEYDPFPTDVFHLGHLIMHEFTEVRFLIVLDHPL